MTAKQSPAQARRRVVLLGATGSIGESTLRVLAAHPDRLELVGIASGRNWRRLAEIAHQFKVPQAVLFDEGARKAAEVAGAFPAGTRVRSGNEALTELATLPEADTVLVAVVGTACLAPTLAAVAAGKRIALASKEILVLAGRLVMEAVRRHQTSLLPVDSEHNAVRQCLEGRPITDVRRIVLTASGGAFRDWPLDRLAHATPAEALQHPNWSMGPKITVDSATLANKGLELIEARWLFDLRPDQCDAVLHPPSIVHALVEFIDGSMIAQLSPPSMTFPIQQALLHPQLQAGVDQALDLKQALTLEFAPIDVQRYPLWRLAQAALKAGGGAPAIYTTANDVAVAAFLEGRATFLAIPRIVEHALARVSSADPADLAGVLALEEEARRAALAFLKSLSSST